MIRVIVVDDSAYNRVSISKMLESHAEIKVIDTASNGEEAIHKIVRQKPDVITLDLEMEPMDGFAVLRWINLNFPTPVVIVSSKSSDKNIFKALEMGAVDFVSKPTGRASPALQKMEGELILKVLNASKANVYKREEPKEEVAVSPEPITKKNFEVLLIGASTGGPPVLQKIFSSMPKLPIPVVIAQHMPPVFTTLFAERLSKISKMQFKEAQMREEILAGTVYIAPGGMHTVLEKQENKVFTKLIDKKEDELYCPSVNVLFESALKIFKEKIIAILLTGMGDDGAEGLLKIRNKGGFTIAESEDTAIIFGMPGEAIRLNAVERVLPSWQIPSFVVELLQNK